MREPSVPAKGAVEAAFGVSLDTATWDAAVADAVNSGGWNLTLALTLTPITPNANPNPNANANPNPNPDPDPNPNPNQVNSGGWNGVSTADLDTASGSGAQ